MPSWLLSRQQVQSSVVPAESSEGTAVYLEAVVVVVVVFLWTPRRKMSEGNLPETLFVVLSVRRKKCAISDVLFGP